MPEHPDSLIESNASACTESVCSARYASTAVPVLGPRTVYLYKWLAIFYDGTNRFMLNHAGSTDGWQKIILHNIVTEFFGTPHDVTEEFSPPLIGNPSIIGGGSSDPNLRITSVIQQPQFFDVDFYNPVQIDDFLDQMIGPGRTTGSMKQIMDAGTLLNAQDGDELFWSYKDNITEGLSQGFDPASTVPDRSAVTGELQQVTVDYLTGSTGQVMTGIGYEGVIPATGKPILAAVSYVAFDEFGQVLIAQSLTPIQPNPCIMIEWIITSGGSRYIHPVVTPMPAQDAPYLIPIPNVKTIWTRAPELLPYRGSGPLVEGIVNKLYPQYATEAAWIAAGSHF